MTWNYVINLEEAGCAGCGAHLREGRRVFQRTDHETDEKVTLCPLCMAECVTELFRRDNVRDIHDMKKEIRVMREG
jgi:hypothetical protein